MSSTSVSFVSRGQEDEIIATIFPALKNGTYSGANTQSIKINIAAVPKAPESSATKTVVFTPEPVKTVQTAPSVTSAYSTSVAPTIARKSIFNKWLGIGARSEDVKILQRFLAKDKKIYPERLVTGYFGPLTKRAVGRLQLKYGLITNSRDSAYGVLDINTRTLLNALQ